MPESTPTQHVVYVSKIVDADGQRACDKFNDITKLAEYFTRHNLQPSVVLRDTYKSYGGLTGTAKSWVNEVLAAQFCIKHYKSVKAYEAHVDAHNVAQRDAGKRQSFGHQFFMNQINKQSPSAPAKPSSALNKAVKQGIITASQAKQLAALGIK